MINFFKFKNAVQVPHSMSVSRRKAKLCSMMLAAAMIPTWVSATEVGLTAGEFRVDESGAATYHLPINVPAGRAGVAPAVGLAYSSNNKLASDVGVGWSVTGLSAISRCPKTPVHDNGEISGINFDAEDKFCLDGQRLLLKTGVYGADGATYFTEIESFSTISSHGGIAGKGPAYFKVENKAGETHYYGNPGSVNEVFEGSDAFVEPGGFVEGELARSWAIKVIQDVKGNFIRFNYEKDTSKGTFRVQSIEYTGWTNGSDPNIAPFAEVAFTYDDYTKGFVGYIGGSFAYQNKLLTRIDTKTDSDVFRSYHLDYERSEIIEERALLTAVQECTDTARTNCLPATQFTWQRPALLNTSMKQVCESEPGYENICYQTPTTENYVALPDIESAFATNTKNDETSQIIDINGDGYSDIIYVDEPYWMVSYGPTFNGASILNISDGGIGIDNAPYALNIDFDGDGIRDLLVADSDTSNWHAITFNRQLPNSILCDNASACDDWPYNNGGYYVVDTGIVARGLEGGAQVMDVDGDGLEDIVYRYNGEIQAAINQSDTPSGGFSVKSLYSSAALEGSTFLPTFQVSQSAHMDSSSAIDINGDGRSDMLVKVRETTSYCLVNGNPSPALGRLECEEAGYAWVTSTVTDYRSYISAGTANSPVLIEGQNFGNAGFMNTIRAADFNGDGLTDIAFVNTQNEWFYRLSDGTQLLPAKAMRLTTTDTRKFKTYFIDLNADGRADILQPISDYSWSIIFSRPSAEPGFISFERRGGKAFPRDGQVRFGDIDGDGKLDLLTVENGTWDAHTHRAGINEFVISDITNGFGVNTHIDYAPMTDPSIYVMRVSDFGGSTDTFSPTSGAQVVSAVSSEVNESVGGSQRDSVSISYQYGGLLFHKKGRGNLGFQMLRTIDNQSGVITETQYDQSYSAASFATARMPIYTQQTLNGMTLSSAYNQLAVRNIPDGGYFPFIDVATESQYVVDTGLASSTLVATTATDTDYDDWGNVIRTESSVEDTVNNKTLTTTTVNDYGTQVKDKELGRLASTSVTKQRSGQPAIIRQSAFTYYPDGMLQSSIVSPNEAYTIDNSGSPIAAAKLTTTYTYDEFGNKVQIDVSGNASVTDNAQTRTTKTVYGSGGGGGRFVDYVKDALGQKTQFRYNGFSANDYSGGVVTSRAQVSPNNLVSTTHLDDFGVVTSTIDVTNNVSFTNRAYATLSGTTAFYKVESVNPGAANTEVYFDRWGREVVKRVEGFEGNWIDTTLTYDEKGRPSRSYEPGSSVHFTENTYDILDRVVRIDRPKGTVYQSVSGLTTTTTNELSQQSIVHSNGFGETEYTRDELNNTVAFEYDSYGNLIKSTTTADGQTSEVLSYFDKWGRKYKTVDPVKGTWKYTYNAFGELHTHRTARYHTFTFEYDLLGRKIRSYEPNEGTLCWEYGSSDALRNIGKPTATYKYAGVNAVCGSANASITKTFSYDPSGRPSGISTTLAGDSSTYTQSQNYDSYSRPLSTTYPTGTSDVVITNEYNTTGYLKKIKQGETVLKHIHALNDRLQVVDVTYGNGVSLTNGFEAATGWHTDSIVSDGAINLFDLAVQYDAIGNVEQRDSHYGSVVGSMSQFSEVYNYDVLNRLEQRTFTLQSSGTALPQAFTQQMDYSYDAWGNITSKSGTGHYVYDQTVVHRLLGVYSEPGGAGEQLYSFTYDESGNVTADGKRSFTYGSFDKPVFMHRDDKRASSRMEYGVERELYRKEDCFYDTKEQLTRITSTYLGAYEKIQRTGGEGDLTEHKYHVAEMTITQRDNGTDDIFYNHKDHQGSIVVVTDGIGNVVTEAIYDPWGKRSEIYRSSALSNLEILPTSDRGYTGHKHIGAMDIIHMNGRIYDPTLARFVQADPFIQAPLNSQSYNRYSYVLNNPLSYTDPSGYLWHPLKHAKKIGRSAIRGLSKVFGPELVNLVGSIVAGYFGGPTGAAGWQYEFTRAMGGSPSGALRAAFTSYASAVAFSYIGANFDGAKGTWNATGGAAHIAAHAVTGGVIAKLQGGKFGHGFWSAGLTKGLNINGIVGTSANLATVRVTIAAIVGGTISKLTGGKFANGAITAAFAQMFNGEEQAKRVESLKQKIQRWFNYNAGLGIEFSTPTIPKDVFDFLGIGEDAPRQWTVSLKLASNAPFNQEGLNVDLFWEVNDSYSDIPFDVGGISVELDFIKGDIYQRFDNKYSVEGTAAIVGGGAVFDSNRNFVGWSFNAGPGVTATTDVNRYTGSLRKSLFGD